MRQEDILSTLKAAERPMTTSEIVSALLLDVTPNHRATAHNRLRALLNKGLVRRVGHESECNRTLWEAVE